MLREKVVMARTILPAVATLTAVFAADAPDAFRGDWVGTLTASHFWNGHSAKEDLSSWQCTPRRTEQVVIEDKPLSISNALWQEPASDGITGAYSWPAWEASAFSWGDYNPATGILQLLNPPWQGGQWSFCCFAKVYGTGPTRTLLVVNLNGPGYTAVDTCNAATYNVPQQLNDPSTAITPMCQTGSQLTPRYVWPSTGADFGANSLLRNLKVQLVGEDLVGRIASGENVADWGGFVQPLTTYQPLFLATGGMSGGPAVSFADQWMLAPYTAIPESRLAIDTNGGFTLFVQANFLPGAGTGEALFEFTHVESVLATAYMALSREGFDDAVFQVATEVLSETDSPSFQPTTVYLFEPGSGAANEGWFTLALRIRKVDDTWQGIEQWFNNAKSTLPAPEGQFALNLADLNMSASSTMYLGRTGGTLLTGRIQNLLIWDRPLTDSEMTSVLTAVSIADVLRDPTDMLAARRSTVRTYRLVDPNVQTASHTPLPHGATPSPTATPSLYGTALDTRIGTLRGTSGGDSISLNYSVLALILATLLQTTR